MSTGTARSTPCSTLYDRYGPPHVAQLPWAITQHGRAICSQRLRMIGAIFLVTVPATIMTSDCRGVARNAMPKRSAS